MKDFWHPDYVLSDLLLQTNLSQVDIAAEMGMTISQVQRKQKELGLNWIKRSNRKMSRGHAALTQIMKKLIPGEEIINEYHIGERLMLDVYCPKYKLAAEYHGRQHFDHITRFHETIQDFERAQERDIRKEELCKQEGITLVVFRFNDALTEDFVYDRILSALRAQTDDVHATPRVKAPRKSPLSVKGNEFYEEAKKRRKEYEKSVRQKIKEERRTTR